MYYLYIYIYIYTVYIHIIIRMFPDRFSSPSSPEIQIAWTDRPVVKLWSPRSSTNNVLSNYGPLLLQQAMWLSNCAPVSSTNRQVIKQWSATPFFNKPGAWNNSVFDNALSPITRASRVKRTKSNMRANTKKLLKHVKTIVKTIWKTIWKTIGSAESFLLCFSVNFPASWAQVCWPRKTIRLGRIVKLHLREIREGSAEHHSRSSESEWCTWNQKTERTRDQRSTESWWMAYG